MDANFSELASRIIKDAWEHARQESYKDLEQKYEGVQARLDSVNASRAQAERQVTADHSKIQQINQVSNQTTQVVNDNNKTLRDLIYQLKQPIEIDGRDLLRALEDSAGTSVNKLVTKKTAEIIFSAQKQVETDKNVVLRAQKEIVDRLNSFRHWLLVALVCTVLTFIVPWLSLKLIIVVGGVIGGYVYDRIK